MTRLQRIGGLLVLVSAALMAAALVLSNNWSTPNPLYLVLPIEVNDADSVLAVSSNVTVETKFVLAALLLPLAVGVALCLSLIGRTPSEQADTGVR